MVENHVILVVSILCITQLMLLQAILRLKVRVYRLERENEQKKDKNKRFQELNRHSDKNLHNLREENGVIYASEVFKAKKKLDKWWKDALKRVNNINKGEKDDK